MQTEPMEELQKGEVSPQDHLPEPGTLQKEGTQPSYVPRVETQKENDQNLTNTASLEPQIAPLQFKPGDSGSQSLAESCGKATI